MLRAEAVGLDDEADEGLQVLDAVAVAEGAQRILARATVAQLARDLLELVAERVVHAPSAPRRRARWSP